MTFAGARLRKSSSIEVRNPRPWPPSEDGIEIANRGVVDFDEDDVLVDVGRIVRNRAHPPVIEDQLERTERAGRTDQQDDPGGAETEQDAGDQPTHEGIMKKHRTKNT